MDNVHQSLYRFFERGMDMIRCPFLILEPVKQFYTQPVLGMQGENNLF